MQIGEIKKASLDALRLVKKTAIIPQLGKWMGKKSNLQREIETLIRFSQ